jgi:hypothetical protein
MEPACSPGFQSRWSILLTFKKLMMGKLSALSVPRQSRPKWGVRVMSGLGGGLNRSTQHFILEGKDGVWDGTKIS